MGGKKKEFKRSGFDISLAWFLINKSTLQLNVTSKNGIDTDRQCRNFARGKNTDFYFFLVFKYAIK